MRAYCTIATSALAGGMFVVAVTLAPTIESSVLLVVASAAFLFLGFLLQSQLRDAHETERAEADLAHAKTVWRLSTELELLQGITPRSLIRNLKDAG